MSAGLIYPENKESQLTSTTKFFCFLRKYEYEYCASHKIASEDLIAPRVVSVTKKFKFCQKNLFTNSRNSFTNSLFMLARGFLAPK